MTPVLQETYQAIQDWITRYGYSPSLRDLAQVFGVSSSAVYARLLRLEEAGLVEWPAKWGTGSYRQSHTMRIKKEM